MRQHRKIQEREREKIDQLRLFTVKHGLLQTGLAAETSSRRAVARTASEHGEVPSVPSRNTNADCFEGRGATFSAIIDIY
jgi:hypothetical protein